MGNADELTGSPIRDTPFGLAGFVQSRDLNRARTVANRIRAGRVYLNGAPFDRSLPFGGYKQSGNGREFGVFGFEEYLEVKAILGYRDQPLRAKARH
jgi:aldehyde dehydrogenase (NAD+)